MATGRMLKRNISDSRRLAELKTDSARMLWTWMLPYLDVEGRFHAAPDMIKGKVVPRIKTFNEKNIRDYLIDMARVGLITLYEHDGDMYLQYRKFSDFQTLRKDKEGDPLPAPTECSMITPGPVPDKSRSTHAEFNIKEENIKKEKTAPDKVRHLDCVFLFPEEYEKLKTRYGPSTNQAIEILNNYKMAKGKNYKSDYHACLSDWVKEKINGNNKTPMPSFLAATTWTTCPKCKREILPGDLEGDGCLKCIKPKINVAELMAAAPKGGG